MRALVLRHGRQATAWQVLEPGYRYWFDGDDAAVAYVDTGGAWVAAGEPFAPPERLGEVARAFARDAAQVGRRVSWFATGADLAGSGAVDTLRVGEQPSWRPADWAQTLRGARSLREQLRRARAKGVAVRAVDPSAVADPGHPLRARMDALSRRWLASRAMAPMGFMVQVDPLAQAGDRRLLVAELDGALVGLLSALPVPGRGGWFVEHLLRSPDAPNGTTEALFDALQRALAEADVPYLTLGLAPLSGDVGPWLGRARRWGRSLYDFDGVRAFKAKLRPCAWEPIDVAFPRGRSPLGAIFDVLMAFAGGRPLRFALATLLRGPALVWWALALLLVPWTLLLAIADTEVFFPAPWVKWAWVVFDVGLAVALASLARRWRRGLAGLLAALVTLDAGLTWAQAALWNLPRAAGEPLHAAAAVVACLAPAAAAVVLWSAWRHRAGPRRPERRRPRSA